jgi:hypothetical protein
MEVVVAAPQRLSALNTVFDATELRGGVDSKWEQFGVQFTSLQCGSPCIVSIDPCEPPVTPNPGSLEDPIGLDTYNFYPFTIEWSLACTAASIMQNRQEYERLFVSGFEAAAHKSVANALWNGVPGGPNNVEGLIDVPLVNQLPNSLGIIAAISQLTQALATSGAGSQGVLHMTPYAANIAVSKNLLYRSGSTLRTVVGDHLVIADGGYEGTGPVGSTSVPGVQWIYATGQLYYLKTSPKFSAEWFEFFQRRINKQVIELTSSVLFMWDKCQWFGVPVNVNCDAGCN